MNTPVTPVLLHKSRVQGGPLPLFSVAFFQATNNVLIMVDIRKLYSNYHQIQNSFCKNSKMSRLMRIHAKTMVLFV